MRVLTGIRSLPCAALRLAACFALQSGFRFARQSALGCVRRRHFSSGVAEFELVDGNRRRRGPRLQEDVAWHRFAAR